MARSRLSVIAGKELFDHLRSRKFLLIFAILLVVAIVGMIGGISEYNKSLDNYNKHQSETASVYSSYMPQKPSIISVFSSVATYLVFVGGMLGIAMGFDLVSREKESRSLKILLSHPVYRDEVINGKALGGIAALAGALGVVILIALATLLVYGIIPDGNELALIGIFGLVSFLLIFSYFAIALFLSTAMDESGQALIYTMIIFIVLSILVPTMANNTVMDYVAGSPPEFPQELLDRVQPVMSGNDTKSSIIAFQGTDRSDAAWNAYNERMDTYWKQRQMIHDTLALVSPTMNYEAVSSATTNQVSGGVLTLGTANIASSFTVVRTGDADLGGMLGRIIPNIVALLLFPAVFFGLAYVRFMRLDVR